MSRDMKYSGNEYFGLVPNSWNVTQLKRLCGRITDGSHFSPKTVSDGEKYITVSNVYDDEIHLNEASEISTADFELLQNTGCQPKQGDVLLAKDGTVGRTAIVNDNNFVVLSSLGILSPGVKYRSLYLKRLLDSDALQAQMKNKMKGSALQRITISVIQNLTGTCPSLEEQDAIISYMEPKCASIDSAISKHQQIIEKLEEYRKAVITQAVTNGLNPNVEMKDSGDSIIPIVPSHWLWTRVKFTVNVVRGGSPRPIEQYIIGEKEDGYNWIKIGDATGGGKFIIATKQRIKPDGLNKTRLVHAGTLLLTNSMSFGHPYFLQIDGCIHDGWLAFSDYKGVLPAFLYYYLMSETTAHQFTTTADGSVVQNLNIDKVRNSHIALPPIVEQKAIVQYLDTVDGKINTAIQHHNQIIEKLQEYKQSLIYNAVTGKIDCTTEA